MAVLFLFTNRRRVFSSFLATVQYSQSSPYIPITDVFNLTFYFHSSCFRQNYMCTIRFVHSFKANVRFCNPPYIYTGKNNEKIGKSEDKVFKFFFYFHSLSLFLSLSNKTSWKGKNPEKILLSLCVYILGPASYFKISRFVCSFIIRIFHRTTNQHTLIRYRLECCLAYSA